MYPCPKDAARHRGAVRAAGGKEQFPFLVDDNTGRSLYESDAVARYLYETYGGSTLRPPPMLLESTLLTGCGAWTCSAFCMCAIPGRAGLREERSRGVCPLD